MSMSNPERIEFSAPKREAELMQLKGLYRVMSDAYKETNAECERVSKQRKMWSDHEQSLVMQRNAMHSALNNLFTVIRELEGPGWYDDEA